MAVLEVEKQRSKTRPQKLGRPSIGNPGRRAALWADLTADGQRRRGQSNLRPSSERRPPSGGAGNLSGKDEVEQVPIDRRTSTSASTLTFLSSSQPQHFLA